ncbi:MAG: Hpt domain-containing protein, partial [Acidobacteriia bacterium]|nr:Hpt domain-containing protein [Terriglobia bacterium]
KGTGASYGFPRLSSMGAAIEASAKSSDLDALASSLKELAGYLDTITMT